MYFLLSFLTSIGRSIILSLKGPNSNGGDNGRSVKWLDGLRGIASFLVLMTHLARAWDYDLFFPRNPQGASVRLLQLPVLRIPWQGRIGVTIFGFLTGYVCALKPLKLYRSGNHHAAFTTIAKSAFRRPPRLILPATIALVMSWTIAQLGGFTVGNRADSEWIRHASPNLEDSFPKEIIRFFRAFLTTWTTGLMDYDDHQWALLPLLKGSMLVYITLVATMLMQYRYRMLVYVLMYLYFHQNSAQYAETFGQQFYFGMFLCDMAGHQPTQTFISSQIRNRRLFCITISMLGLFLASYPGERPEWAIWSNILRQISHHAFPPGVNVGRRYTAVGVDMLILAIYLSPSAKSVLARPIFQYLGRHSFAVYLTHGTLLRTALVWMLYGVSGQPWEELETTDKDGKVVPPPWLPRRGPLTFAIAVPVWLVLVYAVSYLWTTYVDSFCARLTQRLESRVFEQGEKDALLADGTLPK